MSAILLKERTTYEKRKFCQTTGFAGYALRRQLPGEHAGDPGAHGLHPGPVLRRLRRLPHRSGPGGAGLFRLCKMIDISSNICYDGTVKKHRTIHLYWR